MAQQEGFLDFLTTTPRGWQGVLVLQGLGIIGNLIAGAIGLVVGASAWLLGFAVASILVLLWGAYRVRRRPEPLVLVSEDQRPKKHRGLIVLVGTGRPGEDPFSQSAWIAIEHHMPSEQGDGLQVCWLVASAGETGSLPIALKLKERCEALNIKAYTPTVDDPFSVQDTYEVVQRIYAQELEKVNLSEQDVIADITGGTSPMFAGMALACSDRRPMQYMYGRKVASVPRLVEFAPRNRRRR